MRNKIVLTLLAVAALATSSGGDVPACESVEREPSPGYCTKEELLTALSALRRAVQPWDEAWVVNKRTGEPELIDSSHPEYERLRLDDLRSWKAALDHADDLLARCQPRIVIDGCGAK